MPRPRKGARANGPYHHPGRSRPYLVRFWHDGEPDPLPRFFASAEEAEEAIKEFYQELHTEGRTVSEALAAYADARREAGATAVDTTVIRIERVLPRHEPLAALTAARVKTLFERWSKKPTRMGKPPSADYRYGVLADGRRFCDWCVERGWLKANPFAKLKPTLVRQTGKEQLTIDEARSMVRHCHDAADAGDDAAVALLVALYMGIRSSEILQLTARDVDDGATKLRVARKKKRRRVVALLDIAPRLQPLLEHRARRGGDLFPSPKDGQDTRSKDWLLYHCKRLCREARVPEVTVHGLRGSLASNLHESGVSAELIQRLLGHDSQAVTDRHYIRPETSVEAGARSRLQLLEGGRGSAPAGDGNESNPSPAVFRRRRVGES